jgi:hypothetical protein
MGRPQPQARNVNTIEANPLALNVKQFDLAFDVDPLFKQVCGAGARPLAIGNPPNPSYLAAPPPRVDVGCL